LHVASKAATVKVLSLKHTELSAEYFLCYKKMPALPAFLVNDKKYTVVMGGNA